MCHGLSRNLECKCSVEKRFIPSQRRFVNGIFLRTHFHSHKHGPQWGKIISELQAFLHFRGFDFRNFQFTAVYNSILFSSPLVLKYQFWKSLRKNATLSSWTLSQNICPHFWVWLLLYSAITAKSEDKYVVKVFNWSEVQLSEMTCYKIHTLVPVVRK